MHSSTLFSTALIAATAVFAQSPPGYSPGTNHSLGLIYNGTNITANTLRTNEGWEDKPTIYSNGSHPSTYMILMVDLDIEDSLIDEFYNDTNNAYLAPGLVANMTTRLHWWGVNYTQESNGIFVNSTDAMAEYYPPNVTSGNGIHTYVFYLWDSTNYTLPEEALEGDYYGEGLDRFNFSIVAIADQIGDPVLASYIRSENANDTDTTT